MKLHLRNAVAAAGLLVLLPGCLSAEALAVEHPTAALFSTLVSQPGDAVAFYASAYDEDERLLETNSFVLARHLNVTEDRPIKTPDLYRPTELILGAGESGALGEAFEAFLYNRSVGEVFVTPLVDANETLTGPLGDPVQLQRRHGPFPLIETVDEVKFRERFPNASVGDVVKLNLRFFVSIEDITQGRVTYRFLVKDEGAAPLLALGPNATLATEVDEEAGVFYDRIDIPDQTSFRRQNDRVFGLLNGTYLVLDLNPSTITLQRLKAPVFGFELKDVYFVVEVVDIRRGSE